MLTSVPRWSVLGYDSNVAWRNYFVTKAKAILMIMWESKCIDTLRPKQNARGVTFHKEYLMCIFVRYVLYFDSNFTDDWFSVDEYDKNVHYKNSMITKPSLYDYMAPKTAKDFRYGAPQQR